MERFRRLFFAALCAGVLSGAVAAVAHHIGAVPAILEAEVFEQGANAAPAAQHAHEHVDGHDHAAAAWQPEDGLERTVSTGLTDMLMGIGFALLLVSAYALKGGAMDWRRGLAWGLAGFATFTLAPSLGLPPELPGTEAAPLLNRQIWWGATALLTGGGLALVAFRRGAAWMILALGLIVLPHLIGAPHPAEDVSAAPVALAQRFVAAATVASLLFWLCLGASTGHWYRRFCENA